MIGILNNNNNNNNNNIRKQKEQGKQLYGYFKPQIIKI